MATTRAKKDASVDYGVEPTTVITADEAADLDKPFVFQVGSELYAIKSSNSFSLDDYGDISDLAAEDATKVVELISYDKRSAEYLSSAGHVIVRRVLEDWFKSMDMSLGESVSSDD